MTDPTNLHDAIAQPWKAERLPDLTPAELALGRAAKRWTHADDMLEAWLRDGRASSGPEWDRMLSLRDLRWTEFMAACWGYPAQPRSFEETR